MTPALFTRTSTPPKQVRETGDEDDLGCGRFRLKGWHLFLLRVVLPPEG
jgi:hypothetical protein